MAINFTYNPAEYTEQDFSIIPQGDHRVRIFDVVEKTFSSGREGFEVTLEVSGYNSKLWHYLIIDAADPQKTNQRLGGFFDCFGITNYNLAAFNTWKGKIGAVRVKHEEYNGAQTAKVAFCLNRKKQDTLAPWKEPGNAVKPTEGFTAVPIDDTGDLPF